VNITGQINMIPVQWFRDGQTANAEYW